MKRRAFNVLAGVSLVMAIAVAGLWTRSVWWAGDVIYIQPTEVEWQIASGHGNVAAAYSYPGYTCNWAYGWAKLPPNPTYWRVVDFEETRNTLAKTSKMEIYFADWLLVLIFSALPAAWLVMRLREHDTTGLCANCGYDLRGSPGPECPECGAERVVFDAKSGA